MKENVKDTFSFFITNIVFLGYNDFI